MLKGYIGKLGKNSMIYGVGNSLTKIFALLLLPFLTAYLTPRDYGVISAFTVFATFIQPIFQLGLSAGIAPIYFSQEGENEKKDVIFHAFLILIITSFLLVFISFLGREKFAEIIIGIDGFGNEFFLYMVSIAVTSLEIPILFKYQFDEMAFRFTIITVPASLLSYGLLLFFVISLKMGLSGYIYGLVIGEILRFALYILGLKLNKLKQKLNLKLVKRLIRYSVPLVPSSFSIYILQQVGRIVLQRKEGLDAAGIYSVGMNLGSVITVATSAVVTAWIPFFLSFKEKDDKVAELLGEITTLYIYLMGTVSMMFFLFSKPVVELLADYAYHDAYQIVGLYACAQFFSGLFSILIPPLYYAMELKYSTVLQFIAAAISIILTEILVDVVGMVGAGISAAVSYFVLNVLLVLWNYCRKGYFRIRYEWGKCVLFFVLYLAGIVISSHLYKNDLGVLGEWIRSMLMALVWLICIGSYMVRNGMIKKLFHKNG